MNKLEGLLDIAFDIIIFGSSVKGKVFPRDIDVVIIADSSKRKIILTRITELNLKNLDFEILSPESLRKNPSLSFSLYHEGISLKFGEISALFGLKSGVLYSYKLKGKTKSEKNRFILSLKQFIIDNKGVKFGSSNIFILTKFSSECEDFLKLWKVSYIPIKLFVPFSQFKKIR